MTTTNGTPDSPKPDTADAPKRPKSTDPIGDLLQRARHAVGGIVKAAERGEFVDGDLGAEITGRARLLAESLARHHEATGGGSAMAAHRLAQRDQKIAKLAAKLAGLRSEARLQDEKAAAATTTPPTTTPPTTTPPAAKPSAPKKAAK